MMEATGNSFNRGLNQDISKTKYSPENYYNLKNFRVVTEKGLSSFSLENESGTLKSFSIPDVQGIYKITIVDDSLNGLFTINGNSVTVSASPLTIDAIYSTLVDNVNIASDIASGDYIIQKGLDFIYIIGLDVPLSVTANNGAQSSLEVTASSELNVIGWGVLRDEVIMFTTSETSKNPTLSTGQIWKFKYDELTEEVINSNLGALVPSKHLLYNHNLNFSTYHRIGDEVVCRYESINTGRVYWTDFNSRIRTINIYGDNLFTLSPDNLDIVGAVNFSRPKVDSIGSGSIPTGSVVQYFYRLLTTGGSQTIFSPGSYLLKLSNNSPNSGGFQDYSGNSSSGSGTRSVTYSIKDIDTSYDVIEHIVVLWEQKDAPNIYKFKEDFIPDTGEITVIHSGAEDYIPITPEELNILNAGPQKCKSITYKDNRLVAANIITEQFDIDFDARSYRFNQAQTASLYDDLNNLEYDINYNAGTYTVPQLGANWTNIPEEADAINLYNYESDANWGTNYQFKYKSDGITLGGSGPNVSYSFINTPLVKDQLANTVTTPPFVSVNRYATPTIKDLGITNETFDISGQFQNMKSPLVEMLFTGYARGETYRFGLVFYNLKGVPSLTKWIGDIKFPEPTDGFLIAHLDTLYSLGIQFNIDTTSIADKISKVEIVRVERTSLDRTRLGTGTILSTVLGPSNPQISMDNGSTIRNRTLYGYWAQHRGTDHPDWSDSGLLNSGGRTTSHLEINGTREHVFSLRDRPMDGYHGSSATYHNVCLGFISPSSQFPEAAQFNPKYGDYIKDLGYYNSTITNYHTEDLDGTAEEAMEYGFYFKTKEYVGPQFNHRRYKVVAGSIVDTGGYLPASSLSNAETANFMSGNPYVVNASHGFQIAPLTFNSPSANSYYPAGIGDKKYIMAMSVSPTEPHISNISNLSWHLNSTGELDLTQWSGTGEGSVYASTYRGMYWKEVSYCRDLLSQYGGKDYESRSKNEYISTGCVFDVTQDVTITPLTVYGGDVYVNNFDSEYLQLHNANSPIPWYKEPQGRKLSCAVMFPCETPINYDLRSLGSRWARDRNAGGAMNTFDYTSAIYNRVYTQEATAKRVFNAKDFLSNFTEEHSHMIWASDEKIDGELIDSWRSFKPNNFKEVEGIYGPINKIINFRDKVLYYQSKAFGIAQINEKSTLPDTSGTTLVLGTGGVLTDFDYISTETGALHQFGIVKTGSSVFHYDTYLKKFFKYGGQGTQPLSDIKGMSSFFANEIDGRLVDTDLTLDQTQESAGVHGVFDQRFNRVLFTFWGHNNIKGIQPDTYYKIDDVVIVGGEYFVCIEAFTSPSIPLLPSNDTIHWLTQNNKAGQNLYQNAFTLSYNESIDAFESFYDFTPKIYLNTGRRILAEDPINPGNVYIHNRGTYGQFYSAAVKPSKLTLLVNPKGPITKIFDNIEWHSECYDSNGIDIFDDTYDSIRVYNDYQDSGDITLVNSANIQRRMRAWRTVIPRNLGTRERMRNPFIIIELTYNNLQDRRFISSDIINYFRIEKL